MNSKQARFTVVSRFIHWLMAIMVIAMLFIGIGMAATESGDYHLLVSIHKPLGIAILIMVIIRIANRMMNPPPALPSSVPHWQQRIAWASHIVLYTLMLGLPLVGWAMLSAAAYPIVIWGPLHLPPIVPTDAVLYAQLRHLHNYLAYLLMATFLAHVGAALLHGLIYRDGVFQSMATVGKNSPVDDKP